MTSAALSVRIERLEAYEAVRQLPARYALALDMRDMNAMVGLFAEDVKVGRDQTGRAALRDYMDGVLRSPFTGTSHHIGGHVIDLEMTVQNGPSRAKGVVYSKNEHETPVDGGQDEWVIMQMMYVDDYVRADGRWYFERRLPLYWYAADLNKPPIGDNKMRWPGTEPEPGNFHKLFPSYEAFWARNGAPDGPVPDPAPLGEFIAAMRGGAADPKVKVRAGP